MAGNYSNTGSWVPNVYSAGLRNVGSYEVSGTPWITGSFVSGGSGDERHIQFPTVAKSVTIRAITGSNVAHVLRVHLDSIYSDNGGTDNVRTGGHFFFLKHPSDRTFTGKFKEIWLSVSNATNSVDFEIIAELTNIPTSSMFTLTGSGVNDP